MLNSIWDDNPQAYAELRKCWLNTRRQNYLARFINELNDGDVVLEVGSGTGNLLINLAKQFPHITFTGVEPIDSYVHFANEQAGKLGLLNLKFLSGSGENLNNLVNTRFRLILSNDVIHHVADMSQLAKALYRVSTPQTEWIAIEPNCLNPYTFIKQARGIGEKNFYPKEFLTKASDWQKIASNYLFLIPPFIKEPAPILKTIESKLEWIPFTAGGVVLKLKPKPTAYY